MIRRPDIARCQGCDATDQDLAPCLLGDDELWLCEACAERLGAKRDLSTEDVDETAE